MIYDAAHCFGVTYKGKSIFNYGDVNTCSFHATKLFHTGEGGAVLCNSKETYHEMFYRHNFGHQGPLDFYGVGINAKMNELQAAMGLTVLPYMRHVISERKKVVEYYNSHLVFKHLRKIEIREYTDWNFSYYPVIFKSEEQLLITEKRLNNNDIYPRRYFYLALNTLNYIQYKPMPIAEDISKRVLCLPLYVGLSVKELNLIISLINETVV